MLSNKSWLSNKNWILGRFASGQSIRRYRCVGAGILLFLEVLLVSGAAPDKHLSVYSTAANYSVPIVQRQGRDYIGLLELLDPLGTVSAKVDPPRWHIHYNNILGEFTVGKTHARIQGRDSDLAGKFLMENG